MGGGRQAGTLTQPCTNGMHLFISCVCNAAPPALTPQPAAQAGGEPQPGPTLQACTPARPGYAADLRDEALQAAGASGALLQQPVTFTSSPAGFGCLVNGQVGHSCRATVVGSTSRVRCAQAWFHVVRCVLA